MPTQFAMDRLTNFVLNEEGNLESTPEMNKVIGIMQEHTDVPLRIQPYNSVEANDGVPLWGSGRGHAIPGGDAFVDPFSHPTVAAHEAAHQGFTSDLALSGARERKREEFFADPSNFSQEMLDKGATMRAEFEVGNKTRMLEEANAQGVAQRAMDLAGMQTDTSGWEDMKAYPLAHRFGRQFSPEGETYAKYKPSLKDFTEGELSEFNRMQKSAIPAVDRQFLKGYNRF